MADKLDRTGLKGRGLSSLAEHLEQANNLPLISAGENPEGQVLYECLTKGPLQVQARTFAALSRQPLDPSFRLAEYSLFDLPAPATEGGWYPPRL